MSGKRMRAYITRDIKENYIVVLFMLMIPIIAVLLPKWNIAQKETVAVLDSGQNQKYVKQLEENHFNMIEAMNVEEAKELLEQDKVLAYIDFANLTVVTKSNDYNALNPLRAALTDNTANSIEVINGNLTTVSYHVFICMILLVLLVLLANPIVFLAERKNGIYHYLMITPLTHIEYTLSKMLFSVISIVFSVVFYILVICRYPVNVSYLLGISLLLAVFATFLSGIITHFFENLEQYMLLGFPLLILMVVLLIIGSNTIYLKKFPHSNACMNCCYIIP